MSDAVVLALYLASGAAVASAAVLTWYRREHAAVLAVLTYGLLADIGQRWAGSAWRPALPHPLAGEARAAFHAGQALHVGYGVAVLAACLVVLGGRAAASTLAYSALVWAGYVAPLVIGYTVGLWDGPLKRVYAIAAAGIVAVLLTYALPPVWRRIRGGQGITDTERVALAAGGAEFTLLGGALLVDPETRWYYARASYGLLYAFAIVVQIRGVLKCRLTKNSTS